MSTITLEHVAKSFGDVVALTDLSCTLGSGLTAVLGPNGAGKSTMIRLICGQATPSAGTVRVFGVDPRADHTLYRRIGLVPQQERVLEHLDAREFVRSAALLHGLADADAASAAALATVELSEVGDRSVGEFSKGMRQRVKVAQAIVHDPELLVLDEPLNGLDPRQRLQMIEVFRRLAEEGRTVLVSSHVLDEVERFGSRILLLARGRVVAEGDFHAVRELMDDRPHRLRVLVDEPRTLAARLVAAGHVDGLSVGADGLTIDTSDVVGLRTAIAGAARDAGLTLRALRPLDDDLESVFRYLVGRR